MTFNKIIFQYDIARGRIPKPETIFRQLDILIPFGLTGIMLYMESVLENSVFPACGSGKTRVDAEYILSLRKYCELHKIDLIPHVQILEHQYKLLALPEMEPFADYPGAACFRLDSNELRQKMKLYLSEIASLFPSQYIHCGGDEAVRLGLGKSRAWLEETGFEQGVADYINELNAHIRSLGKTMLLYSDECIVFPKLTPLLDSDIVIVNWGYCFKDEVYERENHHYARHRQAVNGHDFMVTANNMAEYIFLPFKRLEANVNIWKELGRDASAFIISDWGSYENINPHTLSLLGTFFTLHKLREDTYDIDAFAKDVRLLVGYDAGFDSVFKDMLLAQSNDFFPERFGYPLFPMFLTSHPDDRSFVWHMAFLDRRKIELLLRKMRNAETWLLNHHLQTELAEDLKALANRLVAMILRLLLCMEHAEYTGACWVSQEAIDTQQRMYEECLSRMRKDLCYLSENWDEDNFPSCFERTANYYNAAMNSLAQTLDFKENSMSVFRSK